MLRDYLQMDNSSSRQLIPPYDHQSDNRQFPWLWENSMIVLILERRFFIRQRPVGEYPIHILRLPILIKVVIMLMIPLMLIPKPVFLIYCAKKHTSHVSVT